jgi:hypothetical protein
MYIIETSYGYVASTTFSVRGIVNFVTFTPRMEDCISLTPFETGMVKQYMLGIWPSMTVQLHEEPAATTTGGFCACGSNDCTGGCEEGL